MAAIVGRDLRPSAATILAARDATAAHRYNAAVVRAFADSVAIHRLLTSLNQPSSLRLP